MSNLGSSRTDTKTISSLFKFKVIWKRCNVWIRKPFTVKARHQYRNRSQILPEFKSRPAKLHGTKHHRIYPWLINNFFSRLKREESSLKNSNWNRFTSTRSLIKMTCRWWQRKMIRLLIVQLSLDLSLLKVEFTLTKTSKVRRGSMQYIFKALSRLSPINFPKLTNKTLFKIGISS